MRRQSLSLALFTGFRLCSALLTASQLGATSHSTRCRFTFVPAGSQGSTALGATVDPPSAGAITQARQLVGQGMQAFRSGQVDQSIQLFDQAEAVAGPVYTPYLWQRGISYYYTDRFQDAIEQFRIDTRVNPNDTEEIVWGIASRMRMPDGASPAEESLPALPPGRKDPRRIMSAVYKLFRGEGSEWDLATAGQTGSRADEFYSLFYLGLFCEARGEAGKAASYMKRAVATDYARGAGKEDYMTAVARVHCQLRDWV